jgi:ATP-dependent DNA helicase RecG
MTEMARARLDALAQSTDGFHIAEQDLLLRGPGEMLGTRQSGLPTLRVANLMRDRNLMEKALRDAQAELQKGIVSKTVLAELNEAWTARFGLASVG